MPQDGWGARGRTSSTSTDAQRRGGLLGGPRGGARAARAQGLEAQPGARRPADRALPGRVGKNDLLGVHRRGYLYLSYVVFFGNWHALPEPGRPRQQAALIAQALILIGGLTASVGWIVEVSAGHFDWRQAGVGVAVGIAFGVAFGIAFGVAFGVAVGVAVGVAFGVAAGGPGMVPPRWKQDRVPPASFAVTEVQCKLSGGLLV